MSSKKKGKRSPERVHFFPQEGVSHEGTLGTMALAEDMRDLTQEIIDSFGARVARVAALKQETAAKMKDVRQQMKHVRHELGQKAARLRRFLSTTESSRLRDFRAMHEGIRTGQEARSRHLSGMLAGCRAMVSEFQRERGAAVAHWQSMATSLAKRRASVTQ